MEIIDAESKTSPSTEPCGLLSMVQLQKFIDAFVLFSYREAKR